MASLEFISKRIEGKKKEIAKLENKLERINKAKATDWKVNPYYYREYDLKSTTKDLESAKQMLDKYLAELGAETEKANSRNIPAIVEFLEQWKKTVTKFYLDRFAKYPKAYGEYQEELEKLSMDYFEERKMKEEHSDEWREYKEAKKEITEMFASRFGFLAPYIKRVFNHETFRYDLWEFDNMKLAKELEREANMKYDFIIERTNKIVGEITDASNLSVGEKGDLNGFIIGTRGTAKVQTVGAGGYNIQCYHFRTLIHKA